MENYETCFKSFTIDPKSNQSDQPCRRVVLTSSITLSHQEDLFLSLSRLKRIYSFCQMNDFLYAVLIAADRVDFCNEKYS